MNRDTELVPVDQIIVADRLREDYGDISGLADSIREHGLIHPISIDQDNRLIAGERRLKAMKNLGFTEVECRRWENLDEDERRLIELEENLRRKDLTAYERSKNLADMAETVERVIDRETGEVLPDSGKTNKGGRPPKSRVSEQKVADRLGVPRQTIQDAKQHTQSAESYPFLQRSEWNQSKALEVSRSLNALPEEDRPVVAKLVDEPGTPADRAISMIRNVAQKPSQERKEILRLAVSDDERDRSLAKTRAAEKPPMPDPRRTLLKDAMKSVKDAIRLFPNDPEVSELESIHEQLSSVRESIRKVRADGTLNAAD